MNKKVTNPFFSIITVVKNDEKNIYKTIKSIIGQSFRSYEYIVIDGNSKDKTVNQILKYKKKINYFKSENDNGIYHAMNKGADVAKGTFLLFVNSGDLLTKNALRIIHKLFLKNKELDFIFGTVKRHYTATTIIKSGYDKSRLNYNFDFATSHSTGFFIKLKSFKKVGKFNTKYKCSADYDFYYRAIIKKNLKGSYTNKKNLIGIMKSGGHSSKFNFFQHLLEETKIRYKNGQNLLLIILIFCNAIIKYMAKKIL
jgi:glycosyltransferase involved in cell wall biosynthesis